MTQWQIKGGQKMTRQCEYRLLLELPTCIAYSHHYTAFRVKFKLVVELLHAVIVVHGSRCDVAWQRSVGGS